MTGRPVVGGPTSGSILGRKGSEDVSVDNPHTKPMGFWEWLILQVKEKHPEVIFLAEAFTRPKLMKRSRAAPVYTYSVKKYREYVKNYPAEYS